MDVRRAERTDALAIATVHVRSWQAAYRGLLPQTYLDELDPYRSVADWHAILDATRWPTTGTLVLVDGDDTVVGFAVIGPTRDEDDDPATVAELRNLYLEPRRWRRGEGTTLWEATRDQFVRAGFRSASVWVLHTNAGGRAFYESRGWTFDGTTRPHDWGTFVVSDVRYRVPLLR